MKIRNGFVSNSSSTSFCIYGLFLDDKEVEKIEEACGDIWELAENGLFFHYGQSYGGYFGKEYSSMPDDMTMGEFKSQVSEKLDAILDAAGITGKTYETHDEGWFDG